MLHSAQQAPQGLTWLFPFLSFPFLSFPFLSFPFRFEYLCIPCLTFPIISLCFLYIFCWLLLFPLPLSQVWPLMHSADETNFPSHTGFSFGLKFTMLRCSGGVRPELNRENGGKGIFASRPLTRHPHSPKRGVILGHKSLGSLNHTQDTLLPFLITAVSLHLYSIREINGPEYSAQVDILLWGTWLKCHSVRRTGCERMGRGCSFTVDTWW